MQSIHPSLSFGSIPDFKWPRGIGDVNQTARTMHKSTDRDGIAGISSEPEQVRFRSESVRETDIDVVQHTQVVVTQLRSERNGIPSIRQCARRNCKRGLTILLIDEIQAA